LCRGRICRLCRGFFRGGGHDCDKKRCCEYSPARVRARSTSVSSPRSAARCRSSASPTSRPTRSQARGRMERVFGTLQKRLPQELRLAGMRTVPAANRYLRERFVPDYNARFAVPAAEPGSAFVAYAGRPMEDVLCIQEDRVVGADNCVPWRRHSLQIPQQRHRQHYVRATVRVHEYPDGALAIFDGPRCLARFDPKGGATDVVRRAA
jgi:hypothetical protein